MMKAIPERCHAQARTLTAVIVLLAAPAIAEEPSPGDEAALKRYVLAEYPKALAKLESHYANLRGAGTWTVRQNIGSPEEQTRNWSLSFARSGRLAKLVIDRGKPEGPEPHPREGEAEKQPAGKRPPKRLHGVVARSVTEDYALDLYRATPEKPFDVKFFGKETVPPKEQVALYRGTVAGRIDRNLSPITNCSFQGGGITIRWLLSQPSTSVKRVSQETSPSGHRLLRIDFERTPPPPADDEPYYALRSGWLLVSPEEHWILQKYEKKTSDPRYGTFTDSGQIEYEGQAGGIPTPRRFTKSSDFSTPSGETRRSKEEIFEFTELKVGEVPRREFLASAFGLPDVGPPSAPKSSALRKTADPAGYWMIGLACSFLGVGLLLRHRASRAQ